MSKTEMKFSDDVIAMIEAQAKKRRIASEARQEQKTRELSLMYGSIDSHGNSVLATQPNLAPLSYTDLSLDFSANLEFSKPTEALKLSPSNLGWASMTPDAHKKMFDMVQSMLRAQTLTIEYIKSYIEKNARDVLPMHVFEDTICTVPSMVIATHKPVPDDMKRHFDSLRTIGTMIDYQQYLFACVPWPDPATAKSLETIKAMKAAVAAGSPIPPKTTAAPVAAAPAAPAPATKVMPTNALKHSWTKPGSAR